MKIIKISNNQDIHMEEEYHLDRYYIFLKIGNKKIGKLTLQWFDNKNYYLTSYKIEDGCQGQGWGRKMMQKLLNNDKFKDRPILVRPEPFDDEDYQEKQESLTEMYRKYGFTPYDGDGAWGPNYMILRR